MAWNTRLVTHQHEQWFKNLVDLHELTTTWIQELHPDQSLHFLDEGLKKEIIDDLAIFETAESTPWKKLQAFIDEATAEDFLIRLDKAVSIYQAWILKGLVGRVSHQGELAQRTCLQQVAWKLGRQCAEKHWDKLPTEAQSDLKVLHFALSDSPFSGYPQANGFFVKRTIATELIIEQRSCPHQSQHQAQYEEIKEITDELCELHHQWTKGFIYHLNHSVLVEKLSSYSTCHQRWSFKVRT